MKQRFLVIWAPRRAGTLALVLLLALAAMGGWPAHGFGLAATLAADPNCPSGWSCADIGNPTPPGSETYSNGTWHISGGGKSFYGNIDQERFVWQPLTGDGSITTHLITQTVSSSDARAGLMWRQSADALAPFYALYATPGQGLFMKYRPYQGGPVRELRPWPGTTPLYFEVTRAGDTFSSYLSNDGVNWSFIPESAFILHMNEAAIVGMFVNSDNASALSTATFDSFHQFPAVSGTFSDNIAGVGGSSSYTFRPGASGPITVGSCAVTNGNIYDVSLTNSNGAVLGSGTSASYCNYASATVSAGQAYTVTTTSVSGTGPYRSAWSVGGAQVVWNLSGAAYNIGTVGGSQSVSFPTLSAGGISISTCGPAGANFDLYLTSAGGSILASGTTPSNCESVSYTPGARGLFRLKEVSVSGTGLWSGTITTEIPGTTPTSTPTATATNTPLATATNTPAPPTATNTPAPTATSTPVSNGPVSGMHSGSIAAVGGSDSYTFTPSASGPASIGECAVSTGNRYTVAVYDSNGTLLGSGTNPSYCNWVDSTVTAGQTYTATTTSLSGTGVYRSVWNVNGAQVVWNLTGPGYNIGTTGGSQSVSFPILSTGAISMSTCGPAGSNFDLYLTSAGGAILASGTTPSNCESVSYTPGARGLYRLKEVAVSGPGAWSGSITTE